jgi:hypothetical protein
MGLFCKFFPNTAIAAEPAWTREQIERMDAEFVAQMERAIAAGQEHAPIIEVTHT